MNHLILQFAETPEQADIDMSVIEYNRELNLSVLKGTKTPAISFVNLATETFTKATGEGSDSDMNMNTNLKKLLDTSTETRAQKEVSDSDKDFYNLQCLSATRTLIEVIDSDK